MLVVALMVELAARRISSNVSRHITIITAIITISIDNEGGDWSGSGEERRGQENCHLNYSQENQIQ